MTQTVATSGSSASDPAGHAGAGDRDQEPSDRAQAALARRIASRKMKGRQHGLRAGHDEAPRGAVGALGRGTRRSRARPRSATSRGAAASRRAACRARTGRCRRRRRRRRGCRASRRPRWTWPRASRAGLSATYQRAGYSRSTPWTCDLRILGPAARWGSAGPDGPRAARPRAGAAGRCSLVHRGAVVALDRIVDELWGDDWPENAHNAVYVVASRLRAALGAGLVVSRGGGYAVRPARRARSTPSASRTCSPAAATSSRAASPRRRRRRCARRSRSGAARRWPTSATSRSPSPRSRGSRTCASPRARAHRGRPGLRAPRRGGRRARGAGRARTRSTSACAAR